MVHQHFKLVPSLSVADNVFLGMEIRRQRADRPRRADREARASSRERFGLQVDPTERVGLLSVGIEQRIEILKVLVRGARTIILDEPTAVLTPQESRELFQTLRGFVAEGMTVIFISHHLEEVMEVSDTVTVLRNGKQVATRPTAGTHQGRAGAHDGRPRRQFRPAAARRRAHGRSCLEVRICGRATIAACRPCATSASLCAPARSSALPASPATARPNWPKCFRACGRPAMARPGSTARTSPALFAARDPRGRPCPCAGRPHGARRRSATRRSRPTLLMGRQHRAPWSRNGVLDWKATGEECRGADQALRHPRARSRTTPSSGFRAATSRRWCWRANSPTTPTSC